MNEHRLSEDPRLTAFALGELPEHERAAIEAALRDDPAAQAAVEAIRSFTAEMTDALARETPCEVREVLSVPSAPGTAAAPGPREPADARKAERNRAKILRFPQLYFVIGGMAAACVALVIAFQKPKPPVELVHYTVVELPHLAIAPLAGDDKPIEPNAPESEGDEPRAYSSPLAHGGYDRGTRPAVARERATDTLGVFDPAKPSPRIYAQAAGSAAAKTSDDKAAASAEAYSTENSFVTAETMPFSTFSIEVDNASYANVRRIIEAGRLPPRSAVRIEELLNYFPFHYGAAASGAAAGGAGPDLPVTASLEVASAPWAPDHRLVRVGLQASNVAAAARPAANLVFLLDVSGSMDDPHKLPLVKQSLRLLVDRLRPDDRVAIVTYAGNSGIALPSTPASHAREILAAMDALTAGGSTNGGVGLEAAYAIARSNFVSGGINRVILCTDGDFNVGPTSEKDLSRLVEEKARSGVALTVLGFGMGSERDSTLEVLADKGQGSYGYIDSKAEADKLLVQQINATLVTVAKDVKVQVEFNPARVASYRLIGYDERVRQPERFEDPVSGADLGAGDTITALYEVVPAGAAAPAIADAGDGRAAELLTLKVRCKAGDGGIDERKDYALADRGEAFGHASPDFKFAAAVAEFGMILRDSPYRGGSSMDDVIKSAISGAAGPQDDPSGYRARFIELARQTKALMD